MKRSRTKNIEMSLLVIRTSSMGDVIMTLPLLRSFAIAYPGEELVFVTKKPFDRFVAGIPGVNVFLSDLHGRHKGLSGLFRVWKDLRAQYHITAVADLHNVIRSQVVTLLFRLGGCRVAALDKERLRRRKLVRGRLTGALTHTVERYRAVFARAGYPLELAAGPWMTPHPEGAAVAATLTPGLPRPFIGIAPLAKHKLKTWPPEKMEAMLRMLSARRKCTIFLFGSPHEAATVDEIAARVPGAVSMAGKISLEGEIALIADLDLMVAMDSSNMHLAAMLGVDTLSVWGATHPRAGFSAWGMPPENQVQIPDTELTCRPCTIYGKGTCRRGDLACLEWLTPETVLQKILNKLK